MTTAGSISKAASCEWEAYGRMNESQDAYIGTYKSERSAKRAVDRWVGLAAFGERKEGSDA